MVRCVMRHIPPSIPGYEILRWLGGGPLTQVWSAHCQADGSSCAVKVLRPEWRNDRTSIQLLQREARAGLALRHPHIVGFRDAQVLHPPYFLVMDLIPGESLRTRLRRDYALDLGTALWIARQTAEALAAMHKAGYIHGDVKPDNIRLADSGTAILIDLGFAHRPGENQALLEDGFVLGTANYLAPELCAAQAQDDPQADMFSLGVTLFEMLTGELPYPSGSVVETMNRHRSEPPRSLLDYSGEWPDALVDLVEALLAQQPQQRPRPSRLVKELVALEILVLQRRAA